ncbi:MAB_1171c family putative transporter [Streptomyces thermospinosisporus]|uniref:MAB_1171c family putative transporter n=1 Tax=Streptomyces thermospinosisporus TaxID=161482 RepID=UPI0031D699F9
MTSAPSSIGFYLYGALLLLVCALKIPALVRRPRDTLLRAACLLLLSAGLLMILAAPHSIAGLNRHSGIANVSAPVVYVMTTIFSGASLLLIINWRPAPAEQTRRLTRLCLVLYGAASLAIVLLFWAGDAPVEQRTLFDVHYAGTPCIREMIVLYLGAQGAAMTAASVMCWRWSAKVRGSLRAGLTILAVAYLLIVCFVVMRLCAVAARWTGHDLDFLVDEVSVLLSAPAAVLGALGFALPLAGPRLAETVRAIRQLRQLGPLWRALKDVPTPGAVRVPLSWWRNPPAVLLTGRKTALYDAILALTPHCDPEVRDAAHAAALRAGCGDADAARAAEAAMILVARERQRASPLRPPDATGREVRHAQAQDLITLSRAVTSPLVHHIRDPYMPLQKAANHE